MLEIATGHTRIYAAIKAGITHADLHVGKYDANQMIRAYATENATQRGELGLAVAGAVASAVRYLVKGILKRDPKVCENSHTSGGSVENIQKQVTEGNGIGRRTLTHFFKDIPAIHESQIEHHLANLKSSGEYARIVKEVTEELAQEQADELAELKRREAAAAVAAVEAIEAQRRAEEAQKQSDAKAAREAQKKADAALKAQATAQAKVTQKSGVQPGSEQNS